MAISFQGGCVGTVGKVGRGRGRVGESEPPIPVKDEWLVLM